MRARHPAQRTESGIVFPATRVWPPCRAGSSGWCTPPLAGEPWWFAWHSWSSVSKECKLNIKYDTCFYRINNIFSHFFNQDLCKKYLLNWLQKRNFIQKKDGACLPTKYKWRWVSKGESSTCRFCRGREWCPTHGWSPSTHALPSRPDPVPLLPAANLHSHSVGGRMPLLAPIWCADLQFRIQTLSNYKSFHVWH